LPISQQKPFNRKRNKKRYGVMDMEKDIFQEWLEQNRDSIALIDHSFKNYYQNKEKKPYEGETNTVLATYGDAVLRLVLCDLLWNTDKQVKLSKEKQTYESDESLVKYIAKDYDLLKYLQFDKNDKEIPKDYNYEESKNNNPHKYKYIATAIEACLGAIYLEEKRKLSKIRKIVKKWMEIIDSIDMETNP
jgi:dsRNA-specific ribonuclease